MRVMVDLHARGFIGAHDVVLTRTWVADLVSLGYDFPARRAGALDGGGGGAGVRECGQAATLPRSFTDSIEMYSKDELKAVFEPVACVAWAQGSCIASDA
jgi:hypothetical protein